MLLFLLLACTTDTPGGCDWPDAASDPGGVVEESCGWWAVAVGDHLYANVYLSVAESACSEALGDGLHLNADPIYSNMSGDAAKYTYDIVVDAAGTAMTVDVTCDDATRWFARIDAE